MIPHPLFGAADKGRAGELVNHSFTYGYLAGSNLLHTLTMPNGITLTQQYEEKRNLLTSMAYTRGETSVAERTYSYDALGRPTARTETREGDATRNDAFTHNDRSELTAATLGTAAYSYDYDNIGNRKTAQENAEEATNYDANSLNQYTAVGRFEPTFDAAGNQTLVQTSTGIWNVTYNAENRPVMFTKADGSVRVTCTYDYMGRRATKKVETISPDEETGEEVSTVTLHHRYLYRGYLQVACCDLTRSEHPSLWFILWEPTQSTATRPLAIQKDATWHCYGWDLTKNICEVFSNTGIIKTTYSYTPYGSVTADGNTTQPIQWSSEFYDTELGLVYYNYRHYNPEEGRWLVKDFLASAIQKYPFSRNSPHKIDFLGLSNPVEPEPLKLEVYHQVKKLAFNSSEELLEYMKHTSLVNLEMPEKSISASTYVGITGTSILCDCIGDAHKVYYPAIVVLNATIYVVHRATEYVNIYFDPDGRKISSDFQHAVIPPINGSASNQNYVPYQWMMDREQEHVDDFKQWLKGEDLKNAISSIGQLGTYKFYLSKQNCEREFKNGMPAKLKKAIEDSYIKAHKNTIERWDDSGKHTYPVFYPTPLEEASYAYDAIKPSDRHENEPNLEELFYIFDSIK